LRGGGGHSSVSLSGGREVKKFLKDKELEIVKIKR